MMMKNNQWILHSMNLIHSIADNYFIHDVIPINKHNKRFDWNVLKIISRKKFNIQIELHFIVCSVIVSTQYFVWIKPHQAEI